MGPQAGVAESEAALSILSRQPSGRAISEILAQRFWRLGILVAASVE